MKVYLWVLAELRILRSECQLTNLHYRSTTLYASSDPTCGDMSDGMGAPRAESESPEVALRRPTVFGGCPGSGYTLLRDRSRSSAREHAN